jgi:GMP synthase (glutamine-hydrolysing)
MQKIIIKTGRTYPALAEKLGDLKTGLPANYRGARRLARGGCAAGRNPAASAGMRWRGTDRLAGHGERLRGLECQHGHWLRAAIARDMPVLGICYGHQLLADALGGQVAYHPQGPEAGVVDVQLLPEAAEDRSLPTCRPAFLQRSSTGSRSAPCHLVR